MVGQKYNSAVLESIENMAISLPVEPTAVADADGKISRVEEIKYAKRYDK